MKQLLCLILSVVMLIGCIAPVGYAAEISSDTDVVVQTGDVAIEATNGIGSLLSAEISEVEEETSASELSSHVITDVVVENGIAKVSYSAEDYATVVVALYSEDGLRLLSSTSGEATPDASEVELSFQGDMPEYFLVRAYMMDSADCTPLSEMYETPIYTQSMQELLDSTITDYDPDLVVNFDDDPTTNFAVYNEGVVIVDEVDGVNIVTTNDDENLLYVIENADEIFTSLQSGDIVSYFYGDDEILLCKVDTISVEDNCVTIHGSDNMELEELFSHIKLEMVMDNSDLVEIDDPEASVDSQTGTYAVASLPNGDSSIEVKPIHFDFYHQFPGAEDEGLTGYIDVLLDNTTDLYFADGKTHYQWELKYELSCNFKITVLDKEDKSLTVPVLKNFKLGSISAVGMVYDPQFVFTANCSVNVNTTIYGSSGINCATGRDPINISTPMKMDAQVDIEGNVFIGFDLKPAFYVLNKNVLKVDMSVPIGGNLNGALTGNAFESTLHQSGPDLELHECDVCLKGEIYGSVSLEVSIKFFNSKKIELGGKVSKKFLSFPFYWSFTFGDIDWGSCPYKQYLVAFQVIDQEYAPVPNVTIHADDLSLHTDETGTAVGYFYAGSINVQVSYADLTESKRYNIDGPGRKIKIVLGEEEITFEDFIEGTIEDDVMDDTFLVAHGKCGDNLSWTLNSNGVLTISGSGEMYSYSSEKYVPWYDYTNQILQVDLEEGVTTIGDRAFCGCYRITEIYIPDGLTMIGNSAFLRCSNLVQVRLPDGLTTIGENAFWRCESLTDINCPDSITEIWDGAFINCVKLRSIDIPAGLSVIRDNVFYNTGLTSVTIPDTITDIGYKAFGSCYALADVEIADSVTFIDSGAFSDCDKLVSIELPQSLESISSGMFARCYSLESIELPPNLKRIEENAFWACEKLGRIELPDSLVFMGEDSFSNCIELREIIFYGDCPNSDGKRVFTNVIAMGYYPEGNITWTETKMERLGGAISWTPFSGETIPGVLGYGTLSRMSWILYTSGELVVSGEGRMVLYKWSDEKETAIDFIPWEPYEEYITSVVIEEGITNVGEKAFYSYDKIVSVSLPDTLTEIGELAFTGCGFSSIIIPENVTTIGERAFSGSKLTEISIPNKVTSIPSQAFQRSLQLERVHIGDGVTSIGANAFIGCEALVSVTGMRGVQSIGSYAFQDCVSLSTITFPDTLKSIGSYAFNNCDGLTEIFIPDSTELLGNYAFHSCNRLSYVQIGDGLSSITTYAFAYCDNLESISLGSSVRTVAEAAFFFAGLRSVVFPTSLGRLEKHAFYFCSDLENIYFTGDAPTFAASNAFDAVTANAYYPSDNETWSDDKLVGYGGNLTWIPYTPDFSGNAKEKYGNFSSQSTPTLDAIVGGEYDSEDMGDYIQRTASFSGLMPGEEYVMLSLVSIDTDQPVASENLLYIAQAEAGEDGNLSFTYVQRVTTDPSYVVLCGPATKTLADAQITVPEYYTDGELHVVNPNVVYDGETLLEGRDYEITGQVCFTEAGTYTCFIRGIHNYTGTMQCVYTVGEWNCDENGHDFEDGFCRYCDEEDPDAQPTEPTEPSDPTDPSEPIDPTEPTEPSDPSDPSEPAEPAGEGVIRLSGANRYATGFAVADQLKKNLGVDQFEAVVVAYGQNFPDALTGSYLAAVKNAPILLTEKSVDHTVAAYIDENLVSGGTVYILGGAAAVSESFENALRSRGFAVKRLKGAGRYETNLAILKEAGVNTTDEVLIATGKNYADSLSASATGLPMLLVDKELSEAQKAFLETTSGKFVIIGGTGAVSADVEADLDAIGDVTRVKGANRYGTSVEIAKRYFTDPESAVLAYAQGFPDGLCGGPLALSMGAPLILTSNDSFAAADDYVTGISSGVVTGGTIRISDDTVRAIFDLSPDTPVVKP